MGLSRFTCLLTVILSALVVATARPLESESDARRSLLSDNKSDKKDNENAVSIERKGSVYDIEERHESSDKKARAAHKNWAAAHKRYVQAAGEQYADNQVYEGEDVKAAKLDQKRLQYQNKYRIALKAAEQANLKEKNAASAAATKLKKQNKKLISDHEKLQQDIKSIH